MHDLRLCTGQESGIYVSNPWVSQGRRLHSSGWKTLRYSDASSAGFLSDGPALVSQSKSCAHLGHAECWSYRPL